MGNLRPVYSQADISLFDGRLNVTADAYLIKTRDLLLTVQVASQTGYTNYFANAGRTTNKGWELTVESRNIVRPKFQWSTTSPCRATGRWWTTSPRKTS